MTTLFISDLHLDAERPQVTDLFGRFLRDQARHADALSILGDLFEAWVGDDDPSDTGAFVALENCVRSPTRACRCSSSAATAISCWARRMRAALE